MLSDLPNWLEPITEWVEYCDNNYKSEALLKSLETDRDVVRDTERGSIDSDVA